MPHIIIKAIKGPSKEEYEKAAEQIADIIDKTLGKPKRYTSVSVEEYSYDEWESVYNEHVKGNENIIRKPEYTNPRTFQ